MHYQSYKNAPYISGKENIINKDLGHIPRNFSSSKFSSETCEDESANDVVQTVVPRLKARDLERKRSIFSIESIALFI